MKPQSQKLLAVMGCVDILMGFRALISVIALRLPFEEMQQKSRCSNLKPKTFTEVSVNWHYLDIISHE